MDRSKLANLNSAGVKKRRRGSSSSSSSYQFFICVLADQPSGQLQSQHECKEAISPPPTTTTTTVTTNGKYRIRTKTQAIKIISLKETIKSKKSEKEGSHMINSIIIKQ
jgi:hypothetical protein